MRCVSQAHRRGGPAPRARQRSGDRYGGQSL